MHRSPFLSPKRIVGFCLLLAIALFALPTQHGFSQEPAPAESDSNSKKEESAPQTKSEQTSSKPVADTESPSVQDPSSGDKDSQKEGTTTNPVAEGQGDQTSSSLNEKKGDESDSPVPPRRRRELRPLVLGDIEGESGPRGIGHMEASVDAGALEEQVKAENLKAGGAGTKSDSSGKGKVGYYPLLVLAIGIVLVLVLMIPLKVNAFLALIASALVVSFLAPGSISEKVDRVAAAFGSASGNIAIVIALAAVIGKCMLDSGAADKVVRSFLQVFGEKRASTALMGSGYVLAIPVFFDTVFYLLVPLARSLYRKTNRRYLLYLMAIAAGGAATHTLVPPTPGPLLVANNLGIDLGTMIVVGMIVALPASFAGLALGGYIDRKLNIPMRPLGPQAIEEHAVIPDDELPPLFESLIPVILPVLLISISTVAIAMADAENAAQLRPGQVNWFAFLDVVKQQKDSDKPTPTSILLAHPKLSKESRVLLENATEIGSESEATLLNDFNEILKDKEFYKEEAFVQYLLPPNAKKKVSGDKTRMKQADAVRMNREIWEVAFNDNASGRQTIEKHVWDTPKRQIADWTLVFGNANFALLLSTVAAILTLMRYRDLNRSQITLAIEEALMSAGVIILITAGGAAFGDMLQKAEIGKSIQEIFASTGNQKFSGVTVLFLAYVIAAVLKIAQGSSTVAMIIASAMMGAMIAGTDLGFHPVYLATTIGGGSLFGSWMNDSGFWIVAKMGGLTESETLRSWTLVLVALSVTTLLISVALAILVPMA